MTASKEFLRRRALRDAESAFAPTPYQEKLEREREARFEEAKKRLAAEKQRREEEAQRREAEAEANKEKLEAEARSVREAEIEKYKQDEYRRFVSSGLLTREEFENVWPDLRVKYVFRKAEADRQTAEYWRELDHGGSGGRPPLELPDLPMDS